MRLVTCCAINEFPISLFDLAARIFANLPKLAFVGVTAATALTSMDSTSVIRSASCDSSSSSCLLAVNIACLCYGRCAAAIKI